MVGWVRSCSSILQLHTHKGSAALCIRGLIHHAATAAEANVGESGFQEARWRSAREKERNETKERDRVSGDDGRLILYRAKWIRPIRLLVRLKIFQLGGIVALVIPLAEYSQQGSLSVGTMAAISGVVGGAGAASVALWYYSRRFVGELALVLPNMETVQISVLDFWGNREDLRFDVRDVVPPLKGMTAEELQIEAQKTLIPLGVIGDRQFFLSVRHGHLLDKDRLFKILNGSYEPPTSTTWIQQSST